ncbi:hypothetical protein [Bacillus dicomae]|uniref:Uncharacterized protein n=1 Tax=Bacillus dicomae TaxID=3088378 RepID=A0AC61T4T9_9BACI|nr:hypothetical protein [Bacillus dicomae]TPV43474.1 hypothetical protein FJ659_09630 [Bacillus dicomae]
MIIMSSIGLDTGQNNFLPLSQFLLGALLFLITIELIKKEDSFSLFSSLPTYNRRRRPYIKRIADYFCTYHFMYSNL